MNSLAEILEKEMWNIPLPYTVTINVVANFFVFFSMHFKSCYKEYTVFCPT